MTDPTPERDWVDKKLDDPEFRKAFLEEQARLHREDIRAAVADERERLRRVDPTSVSCKYCGVVRGEGCIESER